MNKNIIAVAGVSLAIVIGGAITVLLPEGQTPAPEVIENISYQIHDDGVSPIEVLPIVFTGIPILTETHYTYNDLTTLEQFYLRFSDYDNQVNALVVGAIKADVAEQLAQLPAREVLVVDDSESVDEDPVFEEVTE